MLRSISFVACAAVAGVVMSGSTAYAADPVGTVNSVVTTVDATVDGAVGDVQQVLREAAAVEVKVPGGDTGGGVRAPGGRSAVVGYIFINHQRSVASGPSHSLSGALADGNLWTCHGGATGTGYTVSCVPASTAVDLTWHCDVLHADVSTTAAGAAARTSLDCDSDGTPEAQTTTVGGQGGHDSKWSVDTRIVSAFTCTIDGGAQGSAVPDYTGGCGDPGLIGLEG